MRTPINARRLSLFFAPLVAAAFFFGTHAVAPSEAEAIDFGFGVQVSVKGGVQLGGIDEPGEETFDGQARPAQLYPGFFGVGGAVGGFIEARFIDLVGLELGFTYEQSNGTGDINDNEFTLSTEDLIVSLHARVRTPGLVGFVFGIGPEFVVPMGASVNDDSGVFAANAFTAAERDETTYLGVMVGAEIDAVYVRIPIELRFRYAPIDDTYDPRLVAPGANPIQFKNNWNYQGSVMIGIGYYLDVMSLL